MTRILYSIATAALIGCSNGFTVTPSKATTSMRLFSSFPQDEVVTAEGGNTEPTTELSIEKPVAAKPAPKKKKTGGHNQEGILAPFVILMKKVLGDEELNKLRGKVISLHSEVIGNFVDTADTEFGEFALRALFELADEDNNGTIEEEELAKALRALGFRHLKDKQISGIFNRADTDANGVIDFEEWKKEAPKTLRTNLIKLAKTNGGELGFLA